MTATTRRRLEFAATIAAGGILLPLGPILGQRHADRWPVDRSGRHRGPVRRRRRA